VARAVSGLPDFSGFKTMLELGCGHGAFSLYLLSENPDLAGTLFDRAPVLAAAKNLAARFGAADRVVCRAGDYLTDDIGGGFDLIFASATLNFAIGRLEPLIKKIHGALRPGGYFVAFQDGMTREGTRPDTMLGAMLPAMAVGGDYCFHQGQIAEAATSCGFKWVRSRTLQTPIGDMDMDVARKAG
jgi:predicted TPR repeat methyltransferase